MELKLLLQIIGVVLGLIYLYLEYKANIYLWVVGLIMPVVHGYLYFTSGLYADFCMQLYYVLAGIYGWIVWNNAPKKKSKGAIQHTPLKEIPVLFLIYAVLHVAIYFFLVKFTNSTVPVMDSFTTALCILAYWMLSKKYVEQWLVWLVVDATTVGLYIYKGIPITAGLYFLYTILAIAGYLRWRKFVGSSVSGN